MSLKRMFARLLSLGGVAAASAAHATEGAMCRSITGMQITPFVGIIPNTPGLQFSMSYINDEGEIGASREAPIAGRAALDLSADVDSTRQRSPTSGTPPKVAGTSQAC